MEAKRFDINKNIHYQYNKRMILLEENGKKSPNNKNRAIKFRYFLIKY